MPHLIHQHLQAGDVRWLSRDQLWPAAMSQVADADVVLDIGCGIRPQSMVVPEVHLCCEAHDEYVRVLRKLAQEDKRFVVAHATADQLVPLLADESVDSVFLLDVIEHIEKEEGKRLLVQCERVARRQIIVFTPLGFVGQEYGGNDRDAWRMNGGYWQTHRSGWTPDDFDGTWQILACHDYHTHDSAGNLRASPEGAFFAVKSLGSLLKSEAAKINFAFVLPVARTMQHAFMDELAQAAAELQPLQMRLFTACNRDVQSMLREQGTLPALNDTLPVTLVRADVNVPRNRWLPDLLKGPWNYFRKVRAYASALVEHPLIVGCDAIVSFDGDLYQLPAAHIAARLLRKPFIACVHSEHRELLRTSQGVKLARYLHRRAELSATKTIVWDGNEKENVDKLLRNLLDLAQRFG